MTGSVSDNGYENAALRRIEQEYENLITQAFLSGLSLVEISRAIGVKRALPICRVLQRNRLIGTSLKRTRFKGPAEMQVVLRRMGLSFSQWCNSCGVDIRIAEAELTGTGTTLTSDIRQAALRDSMQREKPRSTSKSGKKKYPPQPPDSPVASTGTRDSKDTWARSRGLRI